MKQVLTPGDRLTPALGRLPRDWAVVPLKYETRINGRKLPEATPPETEIEYIDISNVDSWGRVLATEKMRFDSAPSRARRVPADGDTIVSTVRTYLRAIAHLPRVPTGLICSTGFAVVSPGARLDPRFLFYWLRSVPIVDEICARSVGVSYPAINPSDFAGLPVCTIKRNEQRAIASFLDRKTTAIDELISRKERLVALLQEKRQAQITQAVTKGLDSSVPVKDSGIGWLGETPAHWRILPVKRFARPGYKTFTDGDWIESPYITDSGVRLIQTGNVGIGEYRDKGFRYVTEETFRALRCTAVEAGDVLICRLDGPVGRACIAPDLGCRMITSVDNAIIKVGMDHDPRYLVYVLSMPEYLDWVSAACRVGGGFRFRISRSQLADFRLPAPPVAEQRQIADKLDRDTGEISTASRLIEAQVERLREYRQALITAAVTGQIDVTKEAA